MRLVISKKITLGRIQKKIEIADKPEFPTSGDQTLTMEKMIKEGKILVFFEE